MCCFLLAAAACLLFGHAAAFADGPVTEPSQLNNPGMIVGVDQGSAVENVVNSELPQATKVYYNDKYMGYEAVRQGKIDAFAYDRLQMEVTIQGGLKGVHLLPESLGERMQIAVGISPATKIPDFEKKLKRFLDELREDGTLDEMLIRWNTDKGTVMPEIAVPEDSNLILKVGTSGVVPPYSYYSDGQLTGYDIELARRFAAWLGAELQLAVYDYGAIIPACASGDVDCIMANLQMTPERAEAIPFSKVLYEAEVGIMVRGAEDAAEDSGAVQRFFSGIAESFEKTFLREGRWRLFVEGIGNTLLITLLSVLFGNLTGFLLFLLCRNGNRAANRITAVCLWLVQGMPVVVLLMVLYYIIFGKLSVSGLAVSVFGFTLTFGAAVFGLLKIGVGAIDRGQAEAACALGYSDRRTFYRIILPQALPLVTDAYRAELISLLKATAVVGYIAVQDLTKMGDIVRSRTYEAFFPLIAVTVIYFALEGGLVLLMRRLETLLNPRRRSREAIRKGVTVDD